MLFVPSPIHVSYDTMFQAIANRSGRMQYYRQNSGQSRIRIGRGDFIEAYNKRDIIAIKPLQSDLGGAVFQLEFYTQSY